MIKYFHFISAIPLFLLLVSCGSSHRAVSSNDTNNSTNKGFTGSEFVKDYSQKLGMQLEEGMNRALIEKIAEWMGTPYKYGGNSKSGVDCSGFVSQIYTSVYQLKVPRTSQELHDKSRHINLSNLQEGDIVFFKINTKETGHTGIYLLNGWFAHASTSKGVMVSSLSEIYWNKYFEEGGRFL